ncbi:methyltransferase domain-containing protein [Crossiella sp. CA-258035]|uniref:class I SAM-dependent methyltransferase n=1 Tax=Crossiella sp. CA-258035 TaxID=2981138 RepID=UPI0024BC5C27|nr:class I SAM-dependent methyltransferase [Crossiella sp. CA-258035]WHT23341.1 methyltransferase domain-containing protein [Crossiella sp. CA-258035]
MLFGKDHARIYDLVYSGRGKDYASEAKELAALVRARKPGAATLLDVACGTGEHLASLRELFAHVEGADLAPAMVDVARSKLPGVTVHLADMSDFALGRTYDVVTCLYSGIAYLQAPQLASAVSCMAAHLAPGGVLVVEPWWLPEKATEGQVVGDVIRDDSTVIARVSHGRQRDGAHHLQCHFLVADEDGIRHFTDTQVLHFFPRELYLDAFTRAGLTVDYLDGGPSGRGLYVGIKP